MPTVVREAGFEILIYTADHGPAHVHVFKAAAQAKIQVANARIELILVLGMRQSDVRKAMEIVAKHYDTICAAWENIYGNP